MIRALVFDFDGLICDTEGPEYRAWSETWAEFGHELTLDDWCKCIGTVGGWDPLDELGKRIGEGFDPDDVTARRRARHYPLLEELVPLPGVEAHLDSAAARGIGLAIASSSELSWVGPMLERIGLRDRFQHLSVYDGSCPAKPDPHLYLNACDALGVAPTDALAYEDSPHGVAAAKAAGLRCVAVPHDLTRHLDFSAADVVANSLEEVTLDDLIDRLGH